MFSLMCVWINGWVNTRQAGDLRRYRGHYDVIIMCVHFVEKHNFIQSTIYSSIEGGASAGTSSGCPAIDLAALTMWWGAGWRSRWWMGVTCPITLHTNSYSIGGLVHGPLTRYVKCRAHPPTTSNRLQRKPPLSIKWSRYASRHVTHVPWCISGSLTRGKKTSAHAQPAIFCIWKEAHNTPFIFVLT